MKKKFNNFMSKAGVLIAGFILGLVTVGFAGIVAANNFSGPSSEPPNGTVSPVFDGLTVRGDFRVEPTGGDTVSMEDLDVRDLTTNRISGCILCDYEVGYDGDQYLKISTIDLDISGDDIEIGNGISVTDINLRGHVTASEIGKVYQRQTSLNLEDNYAGKNNSTYAVCGSGSILTSCTSYVWGDTNGSFSHQGSMGSTAACWGYARQIKETTNTTSRLYVTANCWDPRTK